MFTNTVSERLLKYKIVAIKIKLSVQNDKYCYKTFFFISDTSVISRKIKGSTQRGF